MKLIAAVQRKFLTLPGEKLVVVVRRHWSVFVLPLIVIFVLGLISFTVLVASYSVINYPLLFLTSGLVVLLLIISLSLRSFIDWYFNIYIVTNKKIIELSYSPLASHKINQILLDQVRCTEIDTKIDGIFNDFFDIGHVNITFDRPTHQEEFVFDSVPDPRGIERQLQAAVYRQTRSEDGSLFGRNRETPEKWVYMEDLSQKEGGVLWNI